MKWVVFRVDSNKRLGMGHLSRCFELANTLKKFKIKSYFAIKKDKSALELVRERNFPFKIISNFEDEELNELVKLHDKINFQCIIIDLKKSKNTKFFSKLNGMCKTVVIDNTSKNSLFANLVIWPWVKEQYSEKIIKKFSQKLLVGPEYMQIGNFKTKNEKQRIQNSILVSMGGSDKRQLTTKIISSFQKSKYDFHMDIAIGKFFSDTEKIYEIIRNDKRFSIIQNNKGLIPIMSKYRIGIFSFGLTVCEACFVGLPSIVLSHSIENDSYAKKMAEYQCMKYLGYYKTIKFNKIPQLVFNLMNNQKQYKKYLVNGKKMIDGKGNERIAKKIFEMIK